MRWTKRQPASTRRMVSYGCRIRYASLYRCGKLVRSLKDDCRPRSLDVQCRACGYHTELNVDSGRTRNQCPRSDHACGSASAVTSCQRATGSSSVECPGPHVDNNRPVARPMLSAAQCPDLGLWNSRRPKSGGNDVTPLRQCEYGPARRHRRRAPAPDDRRAPIAKPPRSPHLPFAGSAKKDPSA
jgi:hypothetical protein